MANKAFGFVLGFFILLLAGFWLGITNKYIQTKKTTLERNEEYPVPPSQQLRTNFPGIFYLLDNNWRSYAMLNAPVPSITKVLRGCITS
jgi:hypothetical protein